MHTKTIASSLVTLATGATLALGLVALPASAGTLTATLGVNASSTRAMKMQANAAARLAKIITRSDTAISSRIDDLNKLNARVQAMQNVSATEKSSIASDVQTAVNGLTTLKAKIDADTDATAALSDEKTITGDYRIYALIVPRGYILASADRVQTLTGLMTAISTKLQARISADQTAGDDVTALQSSLADISAKVSDANTQAQNADAGVASLTPDQGVAAQLSANTAALKAARADIKTATADLQAARKDVKSITDGLKALGKSSASASVTASTTAQ